MRISTNAATAVIRAMMAAISRMPLSADVKPVAAICSTTGTCASGNFGRAVFSWPD